jgi:hypothetical protein
MSLIKKIFSLVVNLNLTWAIKMNQCNLKYSDLFLVRQTNSEVGGTACTSIVWHTANDNLAGTEAYYGIYDTGQTGCQYGVQFDSLVYD